MNQLSFLNLDKPTPTGEVLKDIGIRKSIKHTEDICPGWMTQALDFLYLYALKHNRFSGEMVRVGSKGFVPEVNGRAWGAVLLNGVRKGWIRRVGTIHVTNPKAHCCFASEWESCLKG